MLWENKRHGKYGVVYTEIEFAMQHVTAFCSFPSFAVDPSQGRCCVRIALNAQALLLENAIRVTDAGFHEMIHVGYHIWCGTGDDPPQAPPHGKLLLSCCYR